MLCLFVFFLTSCSPKSSPISKPEILEIKDSTEAPSPETQLSEHIKKQLEIGIHKNIIILDFRFGMTKAEVVKQMQKLEREQKIVKRKGKGNRNAFVYELPLPKIGEVDVYFNFYYTEGKLSKVESYPRPPEGKTMQDLLTGCAEVFETKYGIPDVIFPRKDDNSCAKYFWIEGNRQIELNCNPEKVIFAYSDLRVEKNSILPEKVEAADLEI